MAEFEFTVSEENYRYVRTSVRAFVSFSTPQDPNFTPIKVGDTIDIFAADKEFPAINTICVITSEYSSENAEQTGKKRVYGLEKIPHSL
jgi:hypothetical protein